MDWTGFRSQFPALEKHTYLNTASGGVMSVRAAESATQYYQESVEMGDIGWEQWLTRYERDRQFVARFVGATQESIAFLQNASLALNIVARSLPAGSRLSVLEPEFPSCTLPFIRAGHDVSYIPTSPDGFIDADMLSESLDNIPADIFVLSSVQYANGFRADLRSLGEVCRNHGTFFVVDATQSIGAFRIHLQENLIDALVFSGYKWATAGYGNAVLATGNRWKKQDPPLVGWRSARNAYELENQRLDLHPEGIGHEMGHPAFPGIFAMGQALRVLEEPPPGSISKRILNLVLYLRDGLSDLGVPVHSNSALRHCSGIILADVDEADALKNRLQNQGIWVSARQGGIRISVHAYNNRADIDRLLFEMRPE